MLIHFAKKLTIFLKKLFSIFLIFNLTCVSTAQAAGVFVDSFSVNSEETEPRGLTFNNDGTKMFVIGWTGDDVNEYTLSTGFDVSTASFVDSFSITSTVPGGENDPRDVKFNSGGTKMFVLGRAKDKVYEYTLSTGFDVSTGSFVDSIDISSEESAATSLEFNTEGTKMFVLGQNGNDVNEYTLSTGFDVSTASFVDRFDISSEDTSPAAVAFNDDGTKMFVLGSTGDDVNEYTLSCAYKVTSSSSCDDPSTIKDVVGSIEAQTEAAKRFAERSLDSALKRLTFIRSHKKDGGLWSFIGNSREIDVVFSNRTLESIFLTFNDDKSPKLTI